MPMHDWTKVDAGIFHDFHQTWSGRIKERLNAGLLPPDFYALIEQTTLRGDSKRRVPDILALEYRDVDKSPSGGPKSALLSRPQTAQKYKSDLDAFRRKKNVLSIRHVSGDRDVAMIEIISPGNKSGRGALRDLLEKVGRLLAHGVHLLILDPFPPTKRDPNGIHGALLKDIDGTRYPLPKAKPLTFVSYEADPQDDFYADVKHLAVGDSLPDMPVFLESDGCVMVPLEETYQSAWQAVPLRWRRVVAGE
jgi:Protein of unknown function (DUF4058)